MKTEQRTEKNAPFVLQSQIEVFCKIFVLVIRVIRSLAQKKSSSEEMVTMTLFTETTKFGGANKSA